MIITYEIESRHPQRFKVLLDGKHVGNINEHKQGGFYYRPKGSRRMGRRFETLGACKRSVEGTDA